MRLRAETALGIDISDGWINLALLEKNKEGVKLLKTAAGPVPEKAIENGNIEDAATLAKAIKKLKAKNKIHHCPTAMSLVANPALMQILDLPKSMSGNIRQFVRNEVKHYAVLPIQNTAIDFCGLKSSSSADHRPALVVATDAHKVTTVAGTFRMAGLSIDAIEPRWVAYIRACYAKKISQKFDANLLFVTVHDGVVTLCVFRNQALDFVRTKRLEADNLEPGKCFNWLTEEINAIIQFYELNLHNECGKWEVTLLTNVSNRVLSGEIKSLENRLKPAELEVRTLEDAYLDTPVANTEHGDKPSAVAVGLAMKLLDVQGSGLNINLFPPEVAHAKSKERHILINATIAAAVFFLMVLSIGYFNSRVNKVNANIRQRTSEQVISNTQVLLKEQILLQEQIANLSGELNRMNTILNAGSFLEWDNILNEIGFAIPQVVWVTELSCKDNSKMLIEGQAVSYEAVHHFVNMLNTCKHIRSASLITSGSSPDDLLQYSVSCSLIQ